jgi:hypothetical protein
MITVTVPYHRTLHHHHPILNIISANNFKVPLWLHGLDA